MSLRKSKKQTGRPSAFTEQVAERICTEVACGSNLHKLCKNPGFPDRVTVYRWLKQQEGFRNDYARAREDRADLRAERIDDYVERLLDGEIDPNSARVAIDAEKWQAGKEKPKFYGDKVQQELSGPNGGPIQTEDVSAARESLARRIAGVASRIGTGGNPKKPA